MKRTLKRESKVLEIAEIEGMASSSGRGNCRRGRRLGPSAIGSSLCGRFDAGARVGSFLRPRSGWIRGGRDTQREGGRPSRGGPYSPRRTDRRGSRCENHTASRGGWGPRAMVGRCRRDAMPRVGGRSPSCAVGSLCAFGILTKWLSFTRLETRTKESYIYASDRVGNSFAE